MAAVTDPGTPPTSTAPLFGLKSVGRHAVLYAVGNIVSKAVAFVMLPVYTRYLTPADYGIAALIEMTLDVVAIIAGAQIAQGVFRFYHKADTADARRAVISSTLGLLSVTYCVMGVAVFIAAPSLSHLVFDTGTHATLIRLAAVSFAAQSMILVPLAYARVLERSGLVVGAMIVKLLLAVGLNIVFVVWLRFGLLGVFLSNLASNAILALWLGTWTVRQVGLTIQPGLARSLARYGVPLVGVQAATFTMTFSDRYFLQASGSESVVGLYNLAYQFGFLLLMLGFVPIEMIWGPRRFHVARSANPGPVLATAFRLINVSVFTIGVGIALFVGDMLRLMSTPPFHPAANVVPIILIAYVFHGWAMMHDIGVLLTERTEYLTIANWVAAFVALAGFAVLIPRYQATGAGLAAILAFGTRWALTYVFSQRLWPVRYDWTPVFTLAGAATLIVSTAIMLPPSPLPLSLAIHTGFLFAFCVLVWLLPILTPDEKRAALNLLRTLRERGASSPEARQPLA